MAPHFYVLEAWTTMPAMPVMARRASQSSLVFNSICSSNHANTEKTSMKSTARITLSRNQESLKRCLLEGDVKTMLQPKSGWNFSATEKL